MIIGICEDNAIIRNGLAISLKESNTFKEIYTFQSAESLLDYSELSQLNVILMDIGLPKMSGIDCIKEIKKKYPTILFLVLTIYEDNERIFEALCAGASGYLIKKTSPNKLVEAIEETFKGGSPMSPSIARKVVQIFQSSSLITKSSHVVLTEREKEILLGLSEGNNYQQISEILFISPYTVRFHIGNIYEKLHVRTQSEAVAKAIKSGLI